MDVGGAYEIPDGFLVDARLFLTAGQDAPYLRYLEITGLTLRGTFFSGNVEIGAFQVNAASINGASSSVVASDGVSIGMVVFGPEASEIFMVLGKGISEFLPAATSIQSTCLTMLPDEALYKIQADNQECRGKIALAEGAGITLTLEDGGVVRVDATGSTEQNEKCCNSTGEAIKTINGLTPNSYGFFFFNLESFSEPSQDSDLRQVLRIAPDVNGLRLSLAK